MPFQIREAFRTGETRPLQVDWVVASTWTLGLCLAVAAMMSADFEASSRTASEAHIVGVTTAPALP